MNSYFKPLIFCLAIASTGIVFAHAAQASDNTAQRLHAGQVSFDPAPRDAGKCVGKKCAAGGSY